MMQAKMNSPSVRSRLVLLACLMLALALGARILHAAGKQATPITQPQAQNDSLAAQSANATADGELAEGLLTFDSIVWMLDFTFWPFVILVAAGTFFLIYRALADYQDKTRSKLLLTQQITPSNLNQFGGMVSMGQPSRASKLFKHMIVTFNKTNHAESLSDESASFLSEDRTSYEIFMRVMAYLSDSAGALGLLGTVWGIFVTFYGGKLDGARILNGMGVALMTTLVGLIISLILNFFTTTLYAVYNAHLQKISGRAEELRQALLAFQRGAAVRRNGNGATRPAPAPARTEEYAGAHEPSIERQYGNGY